MAKRHGCLEQINPKVTGKWCGSIFCSPAARIIDDIFQRYPGITYGELQGILTCASELADGLIVVDKRHKGDNADNKQEVNPNQDKEAKQ